MSRGWGLSNQDKQHQTAVPGRGRQQQRRCKKPRPLPAGKVLEQQRVLDAALRLARLSDLGTEMWVIASKRETGQGNATHTRAEGCHDEARQVSMECLGCSLTCPQGACQAPDPLCKHAKALPGTGDFFQSSQSATVMGAQDSGGRKRCFPIALQAPGNPGKASRNHLIFLFLLLSMAAAEAPVSVRSLSPVGQTLRQVLGATMLILQLPGTLHHRLFSH